MQKLLRVDQCHFCIILYSFVAVKGIIWNVFFSVNILLLSIKLQLRREAFQFADAIDEVVGQVRTTFQCPQRYGYFADVDNDCKVYHVCNPVMNAEGEFGTRRRIVFGRRWRYAFHLLSGSSDGR